jgi:hypothetical protein
MNKGCTSLRIFFTLPEKTGFASLFSLFLFYTLIAGHDLFLFSVLKSVVRQKAGSLSGDSNMVIDEDGGTFIEAEIHIETRPSVPGQGMKGGQTRQLGI